MPLAGYLLLITLQLEVLKHLGHENFDDNRSEAIFLFIAVWDHVWMKYGLNSSATWKLPNCLSTMQSLLELPFSP